MDVQHHLFHSQHLYQVELQRSNECIEKLNKKLAKIKTKQLAAKANELTRAQQRKLFWSESVTKQAISNVEAQRQELFALLQQCREAIFALNNDAYSAPATPWTTFMPLTPYSLPILSPWPVTPWTPWMSPDLNQQIVPMAAWTPSGVGQDTIDEHNDYDDYATQYDHIYAHEMTQLGPEEEVENGNSEPVKRTQSITIDTRRANQSHKRVFSEIVWAPKDAGHVRQDIRRASALPYSPVPRARHIPERAGEC